MSINDDESNKDVVSSEDDKYNREVVSSKDKLIVVLFFVICLLVIFGAWSIAGRIVLNNVKDFKYGDEIRYQLSIMKFGGSNVEQKSIQVQYTEEAANVFKLLNDELKYKSMKISFPGSTSYSLQLEPEYNHFYLSYYFFDGEDVNKNYTLNISSQENASYIEFSEGMFGIRIMVTHDSDLPDYLEGLFAQNGI